MCVVTEFHRMKGYMLRNAYFKWVTRFKQREELLSLKLFWHVIGKGLHRFSYLIVCLLLPWEKVGLKRKVMISYWSLITSMKLSENTKDLDRFLEYELVERFWIICNIEDMRNLSPWDKS